MCVTNGLANDESAQAVKTILAPPNLQEIPQQQQLLQQQHEQQQQQQILCFNSGSSKLHRCPHCEYCATTAYNLKVHINNRHTNEVKFQCNQCPFYSYTKASLNYHVKSHNRNEYQSCPECSYSTHSKSGLLNHIKTHQKERPFKCLHCPYAAARKMTLKEHMEVLHNSRREIYACEQCSFKTNWARALKKHMKIHNGDMHSCPRCMFSASDKMQLVEHESKVHNMEHREFFCTQCQFATDQQYKLEDHIHKRHEGTDRVLLYSCPECDYKTKWKRLIKGHRRVHTGELFRCSKCEFATITKTRLNEHEMTHLDMSQRNFACPHCSYRATRQTRLNEHITNRHYPEKKTLHRCDKCDFSTLWKSYLKVHKKMHSGEVFKCSRCSYSSPVKSQLLRHERSLHKIGIGTITPANNLYKCTECSYTAARKARLAEHMDVRHNKANSVVHACPGCTFKTIWKKSLKVHMSVHDNDWLTCEICTYKTLVEAEYKSHIQSHLPKDGFKCTMCSFITESAELYNSHLMKSHSESPSSRIAIVGINYLQSHEVADEDSNNDYNSGDDYRGDVIACTKCPFSSRSQEAFEAHLITHLSTVCQVVPNRPKLVYRKVLDGAVFPSIPSQIIY